MPKREDLLIDPVPRLLAQFQIELQHCGGKHQPHLVPSEILAETYSICQVGFSLASGTE